MTAVVALVFFVLGGFAGLAVKVRVLGSRADRELEAKAVRLIEGGEVQMMELRAEAQQAERRLSAAVDRASERLRADATAIRRAAKAPRVKAATKRGRAA